MIDITVLIRGGGDLASGVALRLWRCGFKVVITEIAQPMAVRRYVSYAQAVFSGTCKVEESQGTLLPDEDLTEKVISRREIPVIVDPDGHIISKLKPGVVVDARMLKSLSGDLISNIPLVIGLGPGFSVGRNCQAVIETRRGPSLGRVIWQGPADEDTGIPEAVNNFESERVLRAPCDGWMVSHVDIGEMVATGQILAEISDEPVKARFDGVVRGLLYPGLPVKQGMKIGDIDPRRKKELCFMVSDKALAIAGGVLEAVLAFHSRNP